MLPRGDCQVLLAGVFRDTAAETGHTHATNCKINVLGPEPLHVWMLLCLCFLSSPDDGVFPFVGWHPLALLDLLHCTLVSVCLSVCRAWPVLVLP